MESFTTSVIWRLPSELIDLLVCPLLFMAGSVADSFPNTLLWPDIGTVAGQISGVGQIQDGCMEAMESSTLEGLGEHIGQHFVSQTIFDHDLL